MSQNLTLSGRTEMGHWLKMGQLTFAMILLRVLLFVKTPF